jgi:VIT1/CCC1 family predicted Fe2+/Mn2+ transporter
LKKRNDQKVFLKFQKDEATAVLIYGKLSGIISNTHNSGILKRIASEEAGHYETFRSRTGVEVKPRKLFAFAVILLARILGITFALKLLEKGEEAAQTGFLAVIDRYPELKQTLDEEEKHEQELLEMIEEERLEYVGSMVLGLNDALVELTGALAGLTFAFRNTQLIALSGLITGIAASLSMASSEFLSHRADGMGSRAAKAALYTGIAYIITVILLVLPYLLLQSYVAALILTMATAILIILVFNFYVSVAKDVSFKKHFLEMAGLSLGVAALSFGIGILVREVLGVEI